jgi:hypothetical protein
LFFCHIIVAAGSAVFATSVCKDVKVMEAGYNEAEFLVDFVTEADRKQRGGELADHYDMSDLEAKNNATLRR